MFRELSGPKFGYQWVFKRLPWRFLAGKPPERAKVTTSKPIGNQNSAQKAPETPLEPHLAAWMAGQREDGGRDGRTPKIQLLARGAWSLRQPHLGLSSPANKEYNSSLAFLFHFPTKLGPETRSDGPGSKNGAERT